MTKIRELKSLISFKKAEVPILTSERGSEVEDLIPKNASLIDSAS
jgi:hypothetical protein